MIKSVSKNNVLIFILLFLGTHVLISCREVSKTELIEDIETYVKAIDEVHADPYRLITKEIFVGKAQELKQKIRTLEKELIKQDMNR